MHMDSFEKKEFLEAVAKLPIIRKQIIKYSNRIIKTANSEEKKEKEIEKVIDNIIFDMEIYDIHINDSDLDLLKNTLNILITGQLPFAKQADRIRKLKNPPSKLEF